MGDTMRRRTFLQGVAGALGVAALGPRLPDLAPAIRVEQAESLPVLPAARALLNDGRWHWVSVRFNKTKELLVYVDGTQCMPDGIAQVSVNVTRADGHREVVGASWRQLGSPPTDKTAGHEAEWEMGPTLTFPDAVHMASGDYVEVLSTITVRGS